MAKNVRTIFLHCWRAGATPWALPFTHHQFQSSEHYTWIKKRSGYRQSLLVRAMEMLPLSHGILSRLMDCLGRIRLEEIVSVQ